MMFQSRLVPTPSVLLNKGHAEIGLEGKLCLSVRGMRRLSELSSRARVRLRNNPQAKGRLNVSWSGPLLLIVAEAVAKRLQDNLPIVGIGMLRQVFSEIRLQGYRISPNQLRYALTIFKNCKSEFEVYEAAKQHKTYGDWWNALPEQEKSIFIERRRHQLVGAIKKDNLEHRTSRRQRASTKLADSCDEILGASGQYDQACSNSLVLKNLDRRMAPGGLNKFSGVSEEMRSSWEAFYAKIISSLSSRFYIYEPLGFPLVNPSNGKVECYHPDFLEYRNRRDGKTSIRVIEIKGELSPTGQRKIAMFRAIYINDDLSALNAEQQKLQQKLKAKTQETLSEQFGTTLTPQIKFVVMGLLPWSEKLENFEEVRSKNKKVIAGMMPRLQRKFKDLLPKEAVKSLSRSDLDNALKGLNDTQKGWRRVSPGKAFELESNDEINPNNIRQKHKGIARSNQVQIECIGAGNLYSLIHRLDSGFVENFDIITKSGPDPSYWTYGRSNLAARLALYTALQHVIGSVGSTYAEVLSCFKQRPPWFNNRTGEEVEVNSKSALSPKDRFPILTMHYASLSRSLHEIEIFLKSETNYSMLNERSQHYLRLLRDKIKGLNQDYYNWLISENLPECARVIEAITEVGRMSTGQFHSRLDPEFLREQLFDANTIDFTMISESRSQLPFKDIFWLRWSA